MAKGLLASRPRSPAATSTTRLLARPASRAQARFYGAIAGGADVPGISSAAARDALRGVKIKRLPPRTGSRPPGVGGAARLRLK